MEGKLQNEAWPPRMTLDEKMERLGISNEDFEFYCRTFVHNWSRYRIKKVGEEWSLAKNGNRDIPLTKNAVAYHLLGKYWISTFAPEKAGYLCLDLDPTPDIQETYSRVVQWLKYPLVFQSSDRGGLHVYALFNPDFRISPEKLFNITFKLLELRGTKVGPGSCEIFPFPNKSIRLPLGTGSILLDHKSLRPLATDLKEVFRFIRKNCRRYSFKELYPDLWKKIRGR
jgi:hypothetical protein